MISIITINFNDCLGLEATISSVINQSYRDYEHIVIDGNSTDGSKQVIEKYKEHFSYWVSEPDSGVYEAMNKGITVSKGEYLQFLNSGDVFQDNDVLQDVYNTMEDGLDIYYGDLLFVGNGESKLQTYPEKLTFSYFKARSLGHPASFIKKELFNRVFYYNEELKIVSDWEFFICAVCKFNATYKHISRVIAKFDTNGISSNNDYKDLITKEKEGVLEQYFSFFLQEDKASKELQEKMKKPAYQLLDRLQDRKLSKFLSLTLLRVMAFLFTRKNNNNA